MTQLPDIPAKRYFTIGEVGDLCGVKPHVLRYWEQEFEQLKPIKRRGNRRYYQHHEVQMVRRIRELLYEHGYTISGARNQLNDGGLAAAAAAPLIAPLMQAATDSLPSSAVATDAAIHADRHHDSLGRLRRELTEIRLLLAA